MDDLEYNWGHHWALWLKGEMSRQNLTRKDFVDRSPVKRNGRPEVDATMLGRYLQGQKPTFEKAAIVAQILGLPPVEVVRQAGWLASPEDPLIIQDGDQQHLILRLDSDDEVEAVRAFLSIYRTRPGADYVYPDPSEPPEDKLGEE